MINQELSPEDLAAIDAALTQPDIPLDVEALRKELSKRQQLHDHLSAFFQAASEYSNTYVSDYMPQPHDWIYGSRYRPISPSWARIPEAHYIQVDYRQNNGAYTWVTVPGKLDEKTIVGYELELLRYPEEIQQALEELHTMPSYMSRDLSAE